MLCEEFIFQSNSNKHIFLREWLNALLSPEHGDNPARLSCGTKQTERLFLGWEVISTHLAECTGRKRCPEGYSWNTLREESSHTVNCF